MFLYRYLFLDKQEGFYKTLHTLEIPIDPEYVNASLTSVIVTMWMEYLEAVFFIHSTFNGIALCESLKTVIPVDDGRIETNSNNLGLPYNPLALHSTPGNVPVYRSIHGVPDMTVYINISRDGTSIVAEARLDHCKHICLSHFIEHDANLRFIESDIETITNIAFYVSKFSDTTVAIRYSGEERVDVEASFKCNDIYANFHTGVKEQSSLKSFVSRQVSLAYDRLCKDRRYEENVILGTGAIISLAIETRMPYYLVSNPEVKRVLKDISSGNPITRKDFDKYIKGHI